MFGMSLTKLIVLVLAIYGAWQLFRWFERRGAQPPARRPEDHSPPEDPTADKAVDMEQDPNTGIWRPRDRD